MVDLPRALSIRQPWAWAIVHVGKDVENRNWPTRYRGPVLIHAAKGMTRNEYEDANSLIQSLVGEVDQAWLDRWLGVTAAPARLDRGGIVGVAEIIGCVTHYEHPPSHWFFGPYGFILANVRPLTFTPCRGALGFFAPAIGAADRSRLLTEIAR